MKSRQLPFCIILLAITISVAMAQDPPSTPPQQGAAPAGPQERFGQQQQPQIKPYERVITREAKSDTGLFTVHQIKEKYYYEIPKSELGKEYLWVSQIARTTLGAGYGGQALGSRVVKWERVGDRVMLRDVEYEVVADRNKPIARAVEAANNDTIMMAFNIEALGQNDSIVIDVTRLFTTEVTELSARTRLRARGFDPQRSFVERIVAFPQNIEVEATHTYTSPPDIAGAGGGGGPVPGPPNPFAQGMRPGTNASVVVHYSMLKLPEKPMMPRLFDERVGYFSVRQTDYGKDDHKSPQRTYITRWRLEKKDPSAALSEPVKPIVYYVDPATPTKWVRYVKSGIEQWQQAFEAAGFKNAIIAKDAPSKEEDPDWSPEDARYSVIRWLPSTIENASGPHIHDPRTGEILESDIQMYHNVMNLARDWYFVQVGALDPRAQKLPLPDDLMGQLIEYVIAHEVGHTLGFQHNMKASSEYPLEKVRDREWVKKNGHTPTLMDYSRFNYVAQPEDKIDMIDLIPKIGPYDKWAAMWGYKPIPGARTPEDEKKTLNEWAMEQDKTPWLRFSTDGARGSDPGDQTEAVGDANAIEATRLGLKNLERASGFLLTATSQAGEPYDDLDELYGRLLGQWTLEMNHVANIVGGFNSQQKHAGQQGVRFEIVPKERQMEAVRFLNENAFQVPQWMVKADVMRRIEPTGALDRVKASQQRVLNSLLSNSRLSRMIEQEAIDGVAAYRASDLMTDVRRGIWKELDNGAMKIDYYRRNLQRAYLDVMNEKLNGRAPVNDETRALARGELRSLNAAVSAGLGKATDRGTKLYLEDVRDQISKILDPKFQAQQAAAGPTVVFGRGFDEGSEELSCWPDYAIRREK